MISGEKAEPKGSAISSTDCRHCLRHPFGDPHTDGKCCHCGITREELEPEPRREGCGDQHGPEEHEAHDFVSPAHCAACMRSWLPPGAVPGCEGCGHPQHSGLCRELEMPGPPGDVDECGCLDDRDYEPEPSPEECSHLNRWYTGGRYEASGKSFAAFFCPACKAVGAEEEAPLTPEEEEELEPPEGSEYTPCVCDHIEPEHAPAAGACFACECVAYRTEPDFELPPQAGRGCPGAPGQPKSMHDAWGCSKCNPITHEPPPPQPERRPPYAVSYSVQGHLYEVDLPGDATVKAVDGALVIQHHLGPVAAICSVLPVIDKESNA